MAMSSSQIVNAFVSKRAVEFEKGYDGRNQRPCEFTKLIWLTEKQTAWLFGQRIRETGKGDKRIEGTAEVDGVGSVAWVCVVTPKQKTSSLQLLRY